MQRKCTIHATDSSRTECTRYVTRSACSFAVRGFGNKSQWTREVKFIDRARRAEKECTCKGCNPRAGVIVEAKVAWKRVQMYVYVCTCTQDIRDKIRLPAAARCNSVYLRQIPLDTILSLLYTLTRRHPTGIRATRRRLQLSRNVRKTVSETITYRIAVCALVTGCLAFKSFKHAGKMEETRVVLVQIEIVTTLLYIFRPRIYCRGRRSVFINEF